MTNQQITLLVEKWLDGSILHKERAELAHLLEDDSNQAMIAALIDTELLQELYAETGRQAKMLRRFQRASDAADKQLARAVHSVHFLRTAWFRYAALLLLFAGTITFLYQIYQKPQKAIIAVHKKAAEILPGGDKAMLTLSDGSTILLDTAANGTLAGETNTKITKQGAGLLVYDAPEGTNRPVTYNTISTPKGGKYQISLPDGSKVWLNAASSIRFPTAFVKDREVFITGEVYFEIATDRTKPFRITANGEQINVLGTSLNVNAYNGEASVKTSLVEGSVQINGTTLKPGQAYRAGKLIETNLDQDIAWKNGLFDFQDKSLQEVMRQLELWYDIEVVYEKGIATTYFWGKMSRSISLGGLLKSLETAGVHFRLEGRRLIVLP